jgi:arabinose-5-phosphate isomerase
MNDKIEAARDAVMASSLALARLAEMIGDPGYLRSAVSILENRSGNIVVTGIGKSGLVGRKIAATLQSLRERAIFLHPGEAAHGDMGIIHPGDVALMISNSGETDELSLVMDRLELLDCPTILITSRPEASLARRGQVVLPIPRMPEGCPIGKAPMASTCCQMAVGDALASALVVARGTSVADFEEVHHGGYLGRRIEAVA